MADDSKASDVAARYAQALFDLAVSSEALPAIEADIAAFQAMAKESPDLRTLVGSPKFTAAEQAAALAALGEKARWTATTGKFFGLLAANRRLAHLAAVIAAFQRLCAEHRGTVSAQVTTAVAMSGQQASALAEALRAAFGKDPAIEARVDPAILGGLKVKVGSRLYDASLKSKLDSMTFALKRA
ncbi:MAG: F0F1 ATP synthase subunit delta [Caulobacteraceae bacterium]